MARESGLKKLCFVVGPIGPENSEIRIHSDWLLDQIVQPVVEEFSEYAVERSDRLSLPGLIDVQIVRRVINAELVIADLTYQNPNVGGCLLTTGAQ